MTGPYSSLYGPTDVPHTLRTRIGFRQLEERLAQRGRLELKDLQQLAFANRVYAAELILPELLPHCTRNDDRLIADACRVLTNWDRRAELDSRGAVLFREFWNRAASMIKLWRTPFDPRELLAALREAAHAVQVVGIALDASLGELQSEARQGQRARSTARLAISTARTIRSICTRT